jgi:hypothetical protein
MAHESQVQEHLPVMVPLLTSRFSKTWKKARNNACKAKLLYF